MRTMEVRVSANDIISYWSCAAKGLSHREETARKSVFHAALALGSFCRNIVTNRSPQALTIQTA